MKKNSVSIVIPTRNAGERFKKVLDKIFLQKFKDFELIVIDSESSDGTVELVKKYPAKLIHIKTTEFGHGKTRNYGASLAQGDFVVFLTQDSEPSDENWLKNLIQPFKDKKIAGVHGRQYPRPDENTLDKMFFLSLYGPQDKEWTISNSSNGDNIFSDANSAVRKNLIQKYPYKDNIIVSEDYEWGYRIMKLGYKIYYSGKAKVIHSHSYNLYTLFKRNFDVGVSYKDIYTSKNGSNLQFIKKGIQIYLNEVNHLLKSGKPFLIPYSTIRDFIRFFGINLGKKEHYFSKKIKRQYLSAQRWYWV